MPLLYHILHSSQKHPCTPRHLLTGRSPLEDAERAVADGDSSLLAGDLDDHDYRRMSISPLSRRSSVPDGIAPFEPALSAPPLTAVYFCQLLVVESEPSTVSDLLYLTRMRSPCTSRKAQQMSASPTPAQVKKQGFVHKCGSKVGLNADVFDVRKVSTESARLRRPRHLTSNVDHIAFNLRRGLRRSYVSPRLCKRASLFVRDALPFNQLMRNFKRHYFTSSRIRPSKWAVPVAWKTRTSISGLNSVLRCLGT